MSTSTATLTAATVSRILGKRHARSISHGTMVRGYRAESRGFTATGSGVVTVRHIEGRDSTRTYAEAVATRDAALARYVATLTEAGLAAEVVAPHGPTALDRVIRVTR